MTAKTRLGYEGYGVERAGSFLGKTSSAGGHPVGILTRLSLDGYGVRRYRDFTGKTLTDVIIGGGKRWDWEEYKPPKTVPVKSSDIESISYDKNTSQLIVNFKNDTSYNYSHIPEHKVKNLKRAKSPGGYLHNNIKGKHFVARIK